MRRADKGADDGNRRHQQNMVRIVMRNGFVFAFDHLHFPI
ncbi:hypothetical protein LTSEMIN_3438, partial [Salmonella enterica subsp. enterica serovar Minnesota str. A4-603]